MFTKSGPLYDAINRWKDYKHESIRLCELIKQHKRSPGNALLDVACGTGGHIPYLRDAFTVEGVDLDAGMLEVARKRHPGVAFHNGDMLDFDLGRRFDVVICLFSSIGYVKTAPRLDRAVANMTRHLCPGGVLIIEPFYTPAEWEQGRRPCANFVNQMDLKIARMMVWDVDEAVAKSNFHYLVGTPEGIEHFVERHELGLFTDAQNRAAFASAGLEIVRDTKGFMGRGVYIGIRAT